MFVHVRFLLPGVANDLRVEVGKREAGGRRDLRAMAVVSGSVGLHFQRPLADVQAEAAGVQEGPGVSKSLPPCDLRSCCASP